MEKTTTEETFISNLKRIMLFTGLKPNDIERISVVKGRKVTSRAVRHILDRDRKPSIDTADRIANVFGLSGWQMLIPSLLDDPAQFNKIKSLIDDWTSADSGGKDYIESTAKREATRKTSNGSNGH